MYPLFVPFDACSELLANDEISSQFTIAKEL